MRLLKKILLPITIALIANFAFVTFASAESISANSAQGIEISPTLVEVNASKGKTYNIRLKITNITTSDLIYTPSIDDFNATNETGTPHVILDSTLPNTSSIKTWVQEILPVTLKSRESTEILAKITIPDNAEPGGHYGVIRFAGDTPEIDSTGVGLTASAGVLLLIRVDGAITEKAEVASFYTAKSGSQSSFFENSPINFVTRVKNDGNIHIKPVGNIEIRDMFNNLVTTMSVNADKSNVLPSSIRRFDSQYTKNWMFGKYTANLTLGYGANGQALTSTVNFWVIPYKIILAGLFVLATFIFILSKVVKAYNRYIINKAKNEENKKRKDQSQKKG